MKFHDEELMVMFSAGLSEAFDMLYERYRDRIYRFALASLHSPEDAEDVVQEVFLRLAKSAVRYQPQGKFKAWLFQIAANRIKSLAIGRSRDMVQRTEYEHSSGKQALDYSRDQVVDRDLLLKSLDSLPENQRMVFLLRELEGMDYQTIAHTCEFSLENARILHHRARRQAITFLRAHQGDTS